MKPYQEIQAMLDSLIPLPGNFAIAYLLGDTGSGKSSLIRQLLGTGQFRFPSTRQIRTTVAPTEFIISQNSPLRAAFIIKSVNEIQECIGEILEDATRKHCEKELEEATEETDLIDLLGESSDQRFRLKYILSEDRLKMVADSIKTQIIGKLVSRLKDSNCSPQSRGPVIEWELKTELSKEFEEIKGALVLQVLARIREVCGLTTEEPIPESTSLNGDESDIANFVRQLKPFLSAEEGSISPIIERARICGNLKAPWLPTETELIIIDSEGIGHNLRESQPVLSARHYDYFYDSDAIILIENGSKPFIGGAKTALKGIIENGYTNKLFVAFTHLDKVETNRSGREHQIREVKLGLRNAESALLEVDHLHLTIQHQQVFYFAELDDKKQPDEETRESILKLLKGIENRHKAVAEEFIAPVYDYDSLMPYLNQATNAFRCCWDGYLNGPQPTSRPWQTIKAFNRRMVWRQDEYQELKPIAQLHHSLVNNLDGFLAKPDRWTQPIGRIKQEKCLNTLKQELSRDLLELVRETIIVNKHQGWKEGIELSGTGSTKDRAQLIYEIICDCAPELTDNHTNAIKDEIEHRIERCIEQCKGNIKT